MCCRMPSRPGNELRTLIGHNVHWSDMDLEKMISQELSCLECGGKLEWAILQNLFTTLKMAVLPSEGGRLETKSRAMCNHGQQDQAQAEGVLLVVGFQSYSGHNYDIMKMLERTTKNVLVKERGARMTSNFCSVNPF